ARPDGAPPRHPRGDREEENPPEPEVDEQQYDGQYRQDDPDDGQPDQRHGMRERLEMPSHSRLLSYWLVLQFQRWVSRGECGQLPSGGGVKPTPRGGRSAALCGMQPDSPPSGRSLASRA